MRLSDVADSRDNNFDVLRLFAAAIVLVSHSFELTGSHDPVGLATGITLGSLGVALFFAMSGFLILKSWSFQPELGGFLRKRALRILPALWVALAVTALVIGPLVTTLDPVAYFTSAGTWLYIASGSVLLTFGGALPGVFASNPFPDAVNGSLWTLPIEVTAYLLVAGLGVVGGLRNRALLPMLLVFALGVSWLVQHDELLLNLRLYAFFIAGMTLYAYRERIVLSWRLAGVLLAIWVSTFQTDLLVIASATVLPYVTMVIAYRTPATLRGLARFGDVSYGLYIYAFPIQQVVALWLGDALTFWNMMLVSLPAAWLMGLASWRIVERPALRLKPRPRGMPVELHDDVPDVIPAPAAASAPAT